MKHFTEIRSGNRITTNQPVRRLLTVDEAAEYLGRTRRAIEGLVRRRKIPFTKLDRRVQFDTQSLDICIARHTQRERSISP